MWHYTGPEDSTRTNPECVTGEVVTSWVRNITGACDNPRGARRVKAFRADNPPPNEVSTICRVHTIVLDLSLFLVLLSDDSRCRLYLVQAWTNWYSPVSNGNPAEEEEGSQEGSVDSAEYVSNSGETEEESEEEEDRKSVV